MEEQKSRKAEEIKDDEIGLFVSSWMNSVTKHKSINKKASDVYHDIMKKGRDKFITWLEKNVVPIWEKYGYPEVGGSQTWGKFQEEVIWTLLIDNDKTPETKAHYKKLKRGWKK